MKKMEVVEKITLLNKQPTRMYLAKEIAELLNSSLSEEKWLKGMKLYELNGLHNVLLKLKKLSLLM